MKYFLDVDNSSHWYLVEAAHRAEWNVWTDLDDNDPMGWEVPPYAQRLPGHYSQVEFVLLGMDDMVL